MSLNKILIISCLIVLLNAIYTTNSYRYHDHKENDLSLWINEQQVKILSGFSLKVFIINYGWVSPHVKDPNFSTHLPLVPSEVWLSLNTWFLFNNLHHISRLSLSTSPGRVEQKSTGTTLIDSFRWTKRCCNHQRYRSKRKVGFHGKRKSLVSSCHVSLTQLVLECSVLD